MSAGYSMRPPSLASSLRPLILTPAVSGGRGGGSGPPRRDDLFHVRKEHECEGKNNLFRSHDEGQQLQEELRDLQAQASRRYSEQMKQVRISFHAPPQPELRFSIDNIRIDGTKINHLIEILSSTVSPQERSSLSSTQPPASSESSSTSS